MWSYATSALYSVRALSYSMDYLYCNSSGTVGIIINDLLYDTQTAPLHKYSNSVQTFFII